MKGEDLEFCSDEIVCSLRQLSNPGPLQSLLHYSFCNWPTLNEFCVGISIKPDIYSMYLKTGFSVCSNVPMEQIDCLCCVNFSEAHTLKEDKRLILHLENKMIIFIGFYVHPVIIFTPADTQLNHRWGHFGFVIISLSWVAKCRQVCHACVWLLLLLDDKVFRKHVRLSLWILEPCIKTYWLFGVLWKSTFYWNEMYLLVQ